MLIRDRDNGCLVKQEQKLQPLIGVLRWTNQSEIKAAGQQPRQQAQGLILEQLNRDVRPLLSEIVKEHRKQPGRSTVDRAHTDSCCLLSAARPEFGGEYIGLSQ